MEREPATKVVSPGEMDADKLLAKVHKRLGLGIDIQTFSDGTVEIQWRRDYGDDGGSSRERPAIAIGTGPRALADALQFILDYEDEQDKHDAIEAGE